VQVVLVPVVAQAGPVARAVPARLAVPGQAELEPQAGPGLRAQVALGPQGPQAQVVPVLRAHHSRPCPFLLRQSAGSRRPWLL